MTSIPRPTPPEMMIYGSFFRGKDVQPSTSKWLLSRGVNVVIAAAPLAHVSSRCIAYIRMILHMVHFNRDHVHSLGNNTAYLRTTLHMFYIRQHMCTGQKFQKVENDENRFFAITSSKLFKNWFCKGHIFSNNIFHNHCFLYVL